MTNQIQRWEHREDRNGMYACDDTNIFNTYIATRDHLKAISDKDVELRDCRTFIDFKLDDIRVRDEEIERLKQQIKEYENL